MRSTVIKELNLSILRSSLFSISASGVSYLVIILIARRYPLEAVSEYLHAVTLSLVFSLVLDCAAEQSLVHYSKSRNYAIEYLWRKLFLFKAILFSLVLCASYIWEFYTGNDLPQLIAFMIIPAFYMGPVFESYGRNAEYARILFSEKIILLIVTYLLSSITNDIHFVVYAYFAISLVALAAQYKVVHSPQGYAKTGTRFKFPNYLRAYLPVYLVLLSQLVYGNISRLVIEEKLGAIAFASITLALQIVNAISMVQSQVDRHVRPLVINAIHALDPIELMMVVKRYSRLYLAPIVMGCILLSALATEIVSLLFGAKWSDAGLALSFASPLVFTIACMRFVDILVVPLNAGKINLAVNVFAALLLFSLVWLNPSESLASYVMLIVLCQGAHVAFMSTYLYVRTNRVMSRTR